jgi:predicted dehydrogenase
MFNMTTNVAPSHITPEPMRVAFLGGGFMAAVHSRAARVAGAEILGVASSDEQSARSATERLGLGDVYPSAESLFSDPAVELVHICTPNATHFALAAAALRAGKHVICEKPLAISSFEAKQLVELAAENALIAVVPFAYRFHPMVREARARVRSGIAGQVLSIQGSYLQDWLLSKNDDDWRVDVKIGGPSRAFADIGSHLCDLIEFIVDDRIERLIAVKKMVFGHRGDTTNVSTEDIVCVLFETSKGVIGTLAISQVAPGRKNRLALEIGASIESLKFDQENSEYLWVGRRRGSELLLRDSDTLHQDAARYSVLPAGHPQGYQDAFNALIADTYTAVRGITPEGLPVFADGYRSAVLTEAILDSHRTKSWINVSEGEASTSLSTRSNFSAQTITKTRKKG